MRLRVCSHKGCPRLTPDTRCEEHAKEHRGTVSRFKQGQTAYNTAAWQRIRTKHLAEFPMCVNADKKIPTCTLVGDVVHHVNRHMGDLATFLAGPFETMCASCHSRVTALQVWAERK